MYKSEIPGYDGILVVLEDSDSSNAKALESAVKISNEITKSNNKYYITGDNYIQANSNPFLILLSNVADDGAKNVVFSKNLLSLVNIDNLANLPTAFLEEHWDEIRGDDKNKAIEREMALIDFTQDDIEQVREAGGSQYAGFYNNEPVLIEVKFGQPNEEGNVIYSGYINPSNHIIINITQNNGVEEYINDRVFKLEEDAKGNKPQSVRFAVPGKEITVATGVIIQNSMKIPSLIIHYKYKNVEDEYIFATEDATVRYTQLVARIRTDIAKEVDVFSIRYAEEIAAEFAPGGWYKGHANG